MLKWSQAFAAMLLAAAALHPATVLAQAMQSFEATPPVEARPGVILLGKDGAAKDGPAEEWFRLGDQRVVHNVSQATLEPVLPPRGTATGAAVIIAPGGAFIFESMENEGYRVADWLASKGVTAFVLKYRLEPTPSGVVPFGQWMLAEAIRWRSGKGDKSVFVPKLGLAVADAQEAMRVVRARAGEWGIDPSKVGFMGFSAGAMTTFGLVSANAPGTQPDFVVPIYGPLATAEFPLPEKLPPMFTALAGDDELFAKSDFGLVRAWQAKAPVELHLFENGGHGFGFSGGAGTTAANWKMSLLWWLQARGIAADDRVKPDDRGSRR